MKRLVMTTVIPAALSAVAVIALAQGRPTTQPRRPARKISWVNPKLPAGPGLSHHVLHSQAMGHDVGYVVWVPSGYDAKADHRYPVIYFLHGAGGNESSDSAGFSGHVAAAIKKGILSPAICVFANGGMSGYRGTVEKMLLEELIPQVDKTWRTIAKPASRAVAGFSMGGAGATRLAITHPDRFCASASWGGGARAGDTALAKAATDNAGTLKTHGVAIMQIKGDRDGPEGNQEFAKHLDSLGIANELIVLKDTPHNLGLYYERSAERMMRFLARHIRKAP
ncbi:MAG TPA: alpha/beta hydrolase-fold protein [Phycisphaerae bacterium]|nr:alpha/beta hydrolase-fold protein [Phycisphaerae bacterium]